MRCPKCDEGMKDYQDMNDVFLFCNNEDCEYYGIRRVHIEEQVDEKDSYQEETEEKDTSDNPLESNKSTDIDSYQEETEEKDTSDNPLESNKSTDMISILKWSGILLGIGYLIFRILSA